MGGNPLGEKYIFLILFYIYTIYIYLIFNQNIKFSNLLISIFHVKKEKVFCISVCIS